MTMKVVFEKETYRLLGAQIVGYEGVDKRIDVLATAIRAGMTAIRAEGLGPGLCAALFLGKRPCQYGWLYDRQHRKRSI